MNDDAHIIGPICNRGDCTLKLVQGDQTLGRLIYWDSTRTVVSVVPWEGPVFERLVAEAKSRGLLHGKDIPDHLQHDLEHRP